MAAGMARANGQANDQTNGQAYVRAAPPRRCRAARASRLGTNPARRGGGEPVLDGLVVGPGPGVSSVGGPPRASTLSPACMLRRPERVVLMTHPDPQGGPDLQIPVSISGGVEAPADYGPETVANAAAWTVPDVVTAREVVAAITEMATSSGAMLMALGSCCRCGVRVASVSTPFCPPCTGPAWAAARAVLAEAGDPVPPAESPMSEGVEAWRRAQGAQGARGVRGWIRDHLGR